MSQFSQRLPTFLAVGIIGFPFFSSPFCFGFFVREREREMGISDGFEGSDVVDCSVGTIVWVRRRNGSWWPGKILGPNELSASHLMSPRSGTPVKLLGREDASVDWYNLEKSKRVKAFRCGEFDDCIERAESSQGVPIKKREKYARREDAILHALELEKQQLEKKQQKSGISSNCMSGKVHGDLKKHSGSSSESLGNSHGNCESILSPQPPKKRESSFEDESMENTTHAQKVKQAKQLNGDDKNSEAMPRMRGLQDLGLRIAPLKRKFLSITSEGSGKPKVDNHSHVTHSSGHVMGAANHVSRTKISFAKHKRSQRGLTEESLFRRRDRRRPLVQVLQSSAKLPVCNNLQSDCDAFPMSTPQEEQIGLTCRAKRSRCLYVPAESNDCLDLSEVPPEQMQTSISEFGMGNSCIHPGSLTEESTSSGSTKDVESDSSVTDYLDPDIDEKMALISDSSMLTAAHPVTHGHRTQVPHESMSSEELGESTINGHMSPLRPHDHTTGNAADTGVSKWQIKGKRNIRNLSRRPTEVTNGGGSSVFNHEIFHKGKGNNLSRKEMGRDFYHSKEESSYDCDGDEMIQKDCFDQMVGLGGGRHISMPKVGFENCIKFGHGPMVSDDRVWEGDELSRSSFKEYWEYPDESFDQLYVGCQHGSGIRSTLVDVDLKVQASYQGERVPLVSLMSRLDGKAIIGHPIQIEALEDCSSNILLSMHNDFRVKVASNNGSTKLPPVWRTARRTAMHRVPRPHQPSALEDEQAGTSLHYPDHESKSLYEKSHAVNFGQDSRLMRGDSSHILQPATEKKLPRKLSRKVSLSGQKTRTLSSIAIERKLSGEDDGRKVVNDGYLDGMIRPEGTGPTTVTCIPVKLVFSRLLEAVGRPPPSQTGGHGVLLNGVTQREPS